MQEVKSIGSIGRWSVRQAGHSIHDSTAEAGASTNDDGVGCDTDTDFVELSTNKLAQVHPQNRYNTGTSELSHTGCQRNTRCHSRTSGRSMHCAHTLHSGTY